MVKLNALAAWRRENFGEYDKLARELKVPTKYGHNYHNY